MSFKEHAARVMSLLAMCGLGLLASCTRMPDDVSVSAFNYTDRPIVVYIDGASAGYTAVGEGGGSSCCHPWPKHEFVVVEWQYDRPSGTAEKPADFVKKRVKVPPLPDCWRPGMGVYLVAHVLPNHQLQLETLTAIAPWPLNVPLQVARDPGKCQVSNMGEKT